MGRQPGDQCQPATAAADVQRAGQQPPGAVPGKTRFHPPQVQVMLTISRLDSGPKQPAVIEARWRLLDQKGDLKDSRVFHEEEQHQGSIGDQIRAQSDLLKRLAAQLAKDVKPIAVAAEAPPPATARKPVAKPKVKEEEGPKMPLVVPIRTDAEVYRF
ncbi:ABC-type transport auxiliary lipoprotein family protein [Pseudomonas aeruginosa]|uniref:ABC-type transport auxiliary lipoprotein family protein n=1 Tax=Pseudomonas aeruginosa TaxID=287 RepID=UPI003B220E9F